MIERFDTLTDPFGASRPDVLGIEPEPGAAQALTDEAFDDRLLARSRMRVVGTALLTGLGAMLLLGAVRAFTRRRSHRLGRSPRPTLGPAARVTRSLGAELATRAMLGAAGVVGAHLASNVLLPELTRRMTAGRGAGETLPRRSSARERLDD